MNSMSRRASLLRSATVMAAVMAVAAVWAARDARPMGAGPARSALPARGIRLGPVREIPVGEHVVALQTLHAVALEGNTLFAVATVEGGHAIVAIELVSGHVQQLTPARSPDVERVAFVLELRASPTHVAWVEYPNGYGHGGAELHLLDRRSLREIVLDTNPRGLGPPEIADGLLVWQNWGGAGEAVFAYDLNSGRQFTVMETSQFAWLRLCSRDWLIYVTDIPMGRSTHATLRAHGVATGDDFLIGPLIYPPTVGVGEQHACAGNTVVWVNFHWKLSKPVVEHRLFDLTTRTTRVLRRLPVAGLSAVHLSRDIVVTSGTGYSLSRDIVFRVASPLPMIGRGHRLLSGDTIVWIIQDQPRSNWRFFTATIERDR